MQSIQTSAFTGLIRSDQGGDYHNMHALCLIYKHMLKQQVQNKDSVTYCWNTTVWIDLDEPVLPEGSVVTTHVKCAAYETHIAGHCVGRYTKSTRAPSVRSWPWR